MKQGKTEKMLTNLEIQKSKNGHEWLELVPFNGPFLTHHPIKGPSNPTQTNCVSYENYFMLFIYGLL